jgi:hypothetical protein
MSKNFENDLALEIQELKVQSKSLKGLVSDTWMCLRRGEGEKEIANQGWSRVEKSFSQETIAIGQRTSRNGEHEPKLKVHRKMDAQRCVQDAQDSRTQLPFFFTLNSARPALLMGRP